MIFTNIAAVKDNNIHFVWLANSRFAEAKVSNTFKLVNKIKTTTSHKSTSTVQHLNHKIKSNNQIYYLSKVITPYEPSSNTQLGWSVNMWQKIYIMGENLMEPENTFWNVCCSDNAYIHLWMVSISEYMQYYPKYQHPLPKVQFSWI